MSKYGRTVITVDELDIEYLLELVEKDQASGGALLGIEVLGMLVTALGEAQAVKNFSVWSKE